MCIEAGLNLGQTMGGSKFDPEKNEFIYLLMSDQHKLNIGSSNNTYNHVYWGFLYHADNVDILLNTHVHDIKFAFRDINCTQLVEFYSNQNYYVANDSYLYVCCNGILCKGVYKNKLQTWSI